MPVIKELKCLFEMVAHFYCSLFLCLIDLRSSFDILANLLLYQSHSMTYYGIFLINEIFYLN